MPIKYKENWVDDFAPKEINSNIGKVFWFTALLSLFFGVIFTICLFGAWNYFDKQKQTLRTEEIELDREILCSLQRIELNKQMEQESQEQINKHSAEENIEKITENVKK